MLPNISKKTKIVCTIGPASQTKEMILKLYASGMNVMRVNFSHGDHEEQLGKIKIARQLENEGIYLPVCLDTKGPEIRTGYMQKGGVPVQAGQRMKILMENVVGDEKQFSVTYSGLYEDVKPGDHILIDDGELDLEVIGKDSNDRSILVEAKNDHLLKDQKGVNCPFSRLSMPFISKQDEKDLAFGVEQHVDAIFASFTRRPEDILDIKRVLAKYGDADIPVFAKIENPEGVSKIDQIIDVADGVMVARGAEGNPVIFREIKATLANIHYDAPSYAMRIAAAIDHAERLTKSRGDRAIVEMRKHVSWYLSSMHGSAALRGRVNSITSLDELKELLNEYLDTVKEKELH